MGLFNRSKTYDHRFMGRVVSTEGTTTIPLHALMDISLWGDTITLSNSAVSFTLNRLQITYAGTHTEREMIAKNKNAVGRGVAGALLFGTTGALVGAASGIGSKNKSKQHYFTSLCYTSSKGEACNVDFEIDELSLMSAKKFNQAVTPTSSDPIQL